MSLKQILVVALAATALSSGAAWAQDTYRCGESRCYDDQADETRRLNEMQLENPGAGLDAVPPPGDVYGPGYDDGDDDSDMNGQGGPYDPVGPDDEDDGAFGAPPPDDSYPPDDSGSPYAYPSDGSPDGAYPDDDEDDGGYPDDEDDAPYPDDE